MKLNYKQQGTGQPMILLHGMFGSLDNLGVIARAFAQDYQVIQVDLRNHGLSPWSDEMNYDVMVDDLSELIDSLSLTNVIIIGHSMGGKVAMRLTERIPTQIAQLIILDIAPATYPVDSHSKAFQGIKRCFDDNVVGRQAVAQVLQQYVSEGTAQFLLKSYKSDNWLFNFRALYDNYSNIRGWQTLVAYTRPVLFIKGERSNYINDENRAEIFQQFPYASVEIVENSGHNVHFENPPQVIEYIKNWLS